VKKNKLNRQAKDFDGKVSQRSYLKIFITDASKGSFSLPGC
jgi:hypothetical protein